MRRSINFLVVVLVLVLSGCGTNETASPPSSSSATEGAKPRNGKTQARGTAPEDPAPDFTVTTFEGEVFSLREQRGTPVVLNFWESW